MAYSYVLVVDDDPAIRGLVADALRGEGYAVDLAAHGREALDALRDLASDKKSKRNRNLTDAINKAIREIEIRK